MEYEGPWMSGRRGGRRRKWAWWPPLLGLEGTVMEIEWEGWRAGGIWIRSPSDWVTTR